MQSSLRAPSQVHLKIDSNSVEDRKVSDLTMLKDLGQMFAAGHSGYNATHCCIFSFVSRNEASLELRDRLRRFLEDEWRANA